MRIVKLTDETKNNILENLLKRSPNSYGKFEAAVGEILSNVRANKDAALFKYTKDFDKADINASNIVVTKEEIEEAYTKVDPKLVNVIRKALKNIKEYHEKQKQYSWFDSKPDGTILGQKVTALSSGCICSRWQGSLSIISSYECYSSQGCWCRADHYVYTSRS